MHRRAHARGFTLTELMVALSGGLFIAMGVFALSKQASSLSMQESRVAAATLGGVVGFERLRTDISRAGFLSTPNVRRDPRVCGNPLDPEWPAALSNLASIQIQPIAAADLSSEATINELAPQRLTLAGSFASIDQFDVRLVTRGEQPEVYLEPNSLGMANLGYPTDPTDATLSRVFASGRILRLVDGTGFQHFGLVDSAHGGENPRITLRRAPALLFREASARGCGIRGNGSDLQANVVNLIRYDLADLSDDAAFAPLFRGGPSYEASRRELVREELGSDGSVIDGTRELIAEYAVDLGFSLLVEPTATSALVRVTPATTPALSAYAAPLAALPGSTGPQHIRALHAWLSVRSREADRPSALSTEDLGVGPTRLRISLNPEEFGPPFARLRSLQSTIPLQNQSGLPWL